MNQHQPDSLQNLLRSTDDFPRRHLGPQASNASVEQKHMLEILGVDSVDQLIDQTVPASIRLKETLSLPAPLGESASLAELRSLAGQNRIFRSYIGMGYHDCHTPAVIQRSILENPGWYTQYTPYQAEIAQGRLEALVNFQTMVCDLTGMEIAGASLLDEATAAAEAMTLCHRARDRKSTANVFFVSEDCHPQTIAVVATHAEPLGIQLVVGKPESWDFAQATFGVLVQYPDTKGQICDYSAFCKKAHESGALVVFAADLLALTLLKTPADFGADVVVGTSQRFGVPLGFGGPHAAFMGTRASLKRELPGRLVGVSKDVSGRPAYRLALQTREQHIRREQATSNICTAQVLLAVMASMYAVYHGPDGLARIARRIRLFATALAAVLDGLGYQRTSTAFFDTIVVSDGPLSQAHIQEEALVREINLRYFADGSIGISLDETTELADLHKLAEIFGAQPSRGVPQSSVVATQPAVELILQKLAASHAPGGAEFPPELQRTTPFLTHPVFHRYHTETELMRYIHRLQSKDLSLVHSMIPLGSCTMKLNAASEMFPITWPEFSRLHPCAPLDQAQGYLTLFRRLETWLAAITGFSAVSLQPNSGAQGEYAGLLAIRAWHRSRGDSERRVCLIPSSAHGTNPASAALAGMQVVVVKCDALGNIDTDDFRRKADEHSKDLAALMVTYPSTHGVFEESIAELCRIVHEHGGQVYMDGANMNAQLGLTSPGLIGADVCHLNLHKTFCIPHGGGGPGMGPICVAEHLTPFLPSKQTGGAAVPHEGGGRVSQAAWGSAGILPIPYAYIRMMGAEGLTEASKTAILNANYIATRLGPHFPVLYKGKQGRVAHECIIDLRPLKETSGVEAEDVAKRLMDYGFHAPTVSFPVAGTLMIEPTESESLEELDRFCEALISIRKEIRAIEEGHVDRAHNLLKDAPFSAATATAESWDRPYTREQAAFPAPWVKEFKFWPSVDRIENVWGDRNLFCTCLPVESEQHA